MQQAIKLLCEIVPLAAFFIVYRLYGMIDATAALVVLSIIAVLIMYLIERKLAVVPLISAIILGIFGALTIYTGNPIFIKMKPTIINTLLGLTLIGGVVIFKRGLIQYLLGHFLPLTPEGWLKLSMRWGLFFLFLAVLNEVIWRNFPEAFWVKFKVIGVLPLNMLFPILQIPLIKKYSRPQQ